jgi:hypothetical protein
MEGGVDAGVVAAREGDGVGCANDAQGDSLTLVGNGEGTDTAAEHVIRILAATRRYNPSLNPTPSERLVRRCELVALLGACGPIVLVTLLVFVFTTLGWSLWPPVKLVGAWTLYFGVFCAAIFLLVDPAFTLLRVGRRMDDPAHHSLGSFRHEQRIVGELAFYPASALASVDSWLATRVASSDGRVVMIFGEKVSVLGLFVVLVSVGRMLFDTHGSGADHVSGWTWIYIAAFSSIVIISAVALRRISTSYAYHRQLLGEATRNRIELDSTTGRPAWL